MKKSIALLPIFLLLPCLMAFGQTADEAGGITDREPSAVLEYFDDPFELEIMDSDGFEIYADYGVELLPGTTVSTKSSSAEIRLNPNGTIIKLAAETQFTVETLQGRSQAQENSFQIATGKLRTIAARVAGQENRYSIKTPSAVCGVRGTDFGMEVIPGSSDSVFVKEGLVEFGKKDGAGLIQLGAGQFADAFAAVFEPVQMSMEQMDSLFSNLDFEKLDTNQVPGKGQQVSAAEEEEPEEEEEEAVEEEEEEENEEVAEEDASDESESDEDTAPVEAVATTPDSSETKPEKESAPAETPPWLSAFGDMLGMELGTVSINDQVYSKLVLQPQIQIGKLSMALYLPVIYSSNLFDPSDWYKPSGNSEWSFGTDKSDALGASYDFLRDLSLKIKYIQYGNPDMDNFFFGIGNLSTMTIGHGILMRNYANDSDFPSTRKLGLNFRVSGYRMGIEGISDDLTQNNIVGTRIFLKPFGGKDILNFGISSIVDIAPDSDNEYGNPYLITLAADTELFKINTSLFSLMAFIDGGTIIPYYRNDVNGISSGFRTQMFYNNAQINNFAVMGGLRGKMLIMKWSLEYRYFKGIFKPGFFGANYDRERKAYAQQVMNYLMDPSLEEFQNQSMGIYGEAAFSLFKSIFFEAGYFWPWAFDSDGNFINSWDDTLLLTLSLEKGLLPIDIEGAVTYEKKHFAETIVDSDINFSLFDSNTVFKGELVYPVSSSLNLAFVISSAIERNQSGEIIYKEDGITPNMVPTIGVESRLSF